MNVVRCVCGSITKVPDRAEMIRLGIKAVQCLKCGSDLGLERVYNLPVPVVAFSEKRSSEFDFDEDV